MAIDTTPGGAAADSYLSVAAADSFADADLGRYADAWVAADLPTKERALRRATRDIDTYIGSSIPRYDADQRLVFPRWTDIAVTGLPMIPWQVAQAAYHQAVYVLVNASTIDDAATRRSRALTNWSEPNVSGAMERDPSFGRLAPEVLTLLGGEGFEGGATVGWIDVT